MIFRTVPGMSVDTGKIPCSSGYASYQRIYDNRAVMGIQLTLPSLAEETGLTVLGTKSAIKAISRKERNFVDEELETLRKNFLSVVSHEGNRRERPALYKLIKMHRARFFDGSLLRVGKGVLTICIDDDPNPGDSDASIIEELLQAAFENYCHSASRYYRTKFQSEVLGNESP
jgi:hypothetical protein